MNRHLEALLRDVGIEGAGKEGFWCRVLVLRATGPFPDRADGPEALTWHGLHLVILDRQGRPIDRVKCRAPFDTGFERECRLMVALGSDPCLRGLVPRTWTAHSDRVRIHRTRQVEGTTFEPVQNRRDTARWAKEASAVLAITRRVTAVAEERFPELRRGDRSIHLAGELEAAFEILAERGLRRDALRSFGQHLSGVTMPTRLQFGDLWPGNILHGPEGWTLIDLERLGFIQFPLYDLFHLIWSSGPARRLGGLQPLLTLVDQDDPQMLPFESGSLLSEARHAEGLDEDASLAALVAFSIELSAYRCRPGMAEGAWRPFLRDLEWLAEWLRR